MHPVKKGPPRNKKGPKIYFKKIEYEKSEKKNCIRLQDLVVFELGFGFLMQNSIYGQMETPGNHQMGLRTLKIYFFNFSSTKNQFFDLQRAPTRSQEGLESSGGPVRIICTKFRPISMVHERAMTKNPREGGGGGA